MKTLNVIVLFLSATLLQSFAADHPQLKAFPPPEEGMVRHVIVLDHKERGEEDAFKVELIPGKVMMTDGVNKMRHGSSLVAKPLVGWGYTFYEVTGKDLSMSTLMAPPPGTPQVERFVAGAPLMIRYNSRLPIVIYAPKGFEVKYKIWEAGELKPTQESN